LNFGSGNSHKIVNADLLSKKKYEEDLWAILKGAVAVNITKSCIATSNPELLLRPASERYGARSILFTSVVYIVLHFLD